MRALIYKDMKGLHLPGKITVSFFSKVIRVVNSSCEVWTEQLTMH